MILYLVRMRSRFNHKGKDIVTESFIGFTENQKWAEDYSDFRQRKALKCKDDNLVFDVITISENKFNKLRGEDDRFSVVSELYDYGNGVILSEDDYEFLESSFADLIDQFEHQGEKIISVLKMFDDSDCKKCASLLKRIIKRIDDDYSGEDIFANRKLKKLANKLIL